MTLQDQKREMLSEPALHGSDMSRVDCTCRPHVSTALEADAPAGLSTSGAGTARGGERSGSQI